MVMIVISPPTAAGPLLLTIQASLVTPSQLLKQSHLGGGRKGPELAGLWGPSPDVKGELVFGGTRVY